MNEQNIFIVRCGEVALKGMNKPYFERVLLERVRNALKDMQGITAKRAEGLIFVRADKALDAAAIISKITGVFGVASVSRALEAESTLEDISRKAVEYALDAIEKRGIKSFKVETKRADKSFPIQSPEVSKRVGAAVLKGCKVLGVDVHEPDMVLRVDIRHERSYIYDSKVMGFGGLPLGTNGKGMVLLSGGIDSPVAAWMMAKRGMLLEAVHFHSYPYTSERARDKVVELANIVAGYTGRFRMHIINLLPAQEAIVSNCPEEETTILVRRFMMRIAEEIAKKSGCLMLITGENLGQVASQTAEALVVSDACVSMPVMRPLIAFDKVDIMEKAKEIGTYETSIQPYEDCCTVFLPRHPLTKPKLDRIEKSESRLDVAGLVEKLVAEREIIEIRG